MPPVGFFFFSNPQFSTGERPQTHALDRAATGTGPIDQYSCKYSAYFEHIAYGQNRKEPG